MALDEYRRKRDFSRTPEPSGEGQPGARPGEEPDRGLWDRLPEGSRFCVQMHRATRLHYDFRLEHGGVLLSWAIPRGPSLDPAARRLAVQTEDHPVDYGDFEGIIPSGYGMGTVELWDAGSFQWTRESAADPDAQIRAGDIKFQLAGEKLRGEFALVRLGGRGHHPGAGPDPERNFLLIKKRDEAAVAGHDAAAEDRSVKSGRTLAEIAAAGGGDPRQRIRPAAGAAPRAVGAPAPGPAPPPTPDGAPAVAPGSASMPVAPRDAPLPSPMLAVAADRPFSRGGWLYELKYDGIRAMVAVDGSVARVVGRRGRDETERYPEAAAIPAQLRARSAVLDCEIVVLDEAGHPDFERLQSRVNLEGAGEARRAADRHPATFVAFDLLSLDGRDLTGTELRIRKKTLRELIGPAGPVLFADHVEEAGESFFAAVAGLGLEGMVAKRADSLYQPGRRSPDWIKVKAWRTQTCAIAGWTEGHGRRGHLGALVLALHGAAGWEHCGQVGTGFGEATIADLLGRLEPLRRPSSPFATPLKVAEPVTWVEPRLVCEVRHAGWTRAGVLRHPAFIALREDVGPEDCVREETVDVHHLVSPGGASPAIARRLGPAAQAPAAQAPRPQLLARPQLPPGVTRPELASELAEALEALPRLRPDDWWQIGSRRLHLTNLDKPIWPQPVITKRRMIEYYVRMSPYLLPYLRDRPLSTQVFPDGVTGHSFWRKDKPSHAPEWIDSWLFEGETGSKRWIVVREAATLGWLANAGVVDLHPWHSRIDAPDQPDWAVYDLDPFEPASFDDIRDIARLVKAALDHLGLRGLLKTSGQTGLQIYVPLRRGPDYARVRGWVEEVARAIGRVEPDRISWEWAVSRRAGRIRIDYTQNIINKTLAAPYSLRPLPGATVSTPLAWEELDDPALRPDRWTMETIWERLRSVGDLFTGALDGDQDLPLTPRGRPGADPSRLDGGSPPLGGPA
jgi:bifunctional non-homologous end joining protein LigD